MAETRDDNGYVYDKLVKKKNRDGHPRDPDQELWTIAPPSFEGLEPPWG